MRMTWALGGAIAAAAALALAGARQRNAVSAQHEPARLAAARADVPTGPAPDTASAVQGKVAELRAVNDEDPLPPGHPDIGSAESADSLPAGHPSLNEAAPFDAPPHSPSALARAAPGSEPALPSPPDQRARGKNGYLIAELVAARNSLAGQPVRVRGQVTKVTDVQDHAFFHVRDTSLAADGQSVDLVVTSLTRPKRGDIATFDGILRTDVDVGIGYEYPALLENATIAAE